MLSFIRRRIFVILEWTLLACALLVIALSFIWDKQDLRYAQQHPGERLSFFEAVKHDLWTIGLLALLIVCMIIADR